LPDVVWQKVKDSGLMEAMRSWTCNLHPFFEMSYALGDFVQNTSTGTASPSPIPKGSLVIAAFH
jgi:hypothetical protein